MLHIITAAVYPAVTYEAVQVAGLPTEPQAIAVYALLAWAVGAVWLGNRNSGADLDEKDGEDQVRLSEEDEVSSGISEPDPSERRRRPGKGGRKLSRSRRRKRGHIDWIQ